VSHSFRDTPNPYAAVETSVRQLIANGNTKAAVESAKAAHKAYATGASEALLVDAYVSRIQALNEQNLKLEAKSLEDLVRSRYPSAQTRLDGRRNALEELLAPLNDPDLAAERRAAIEQAVQRDVHDLAAIAACSVLPQEHALRQAAVALMKAFVAVTATPGSEEELALPEVSHRSPLAPWKLLVRAIGHFYRHEDERSRECVEAIPRESAPARLVPAIRAMLGDKAAPLTPAAARLVPAIAGNSESLRNALDKLDRAFHADGGEKRILQDVKAAVNECSRHAPALLERLKQHISVRCAMTDLEKGKVAGAMGGGASHDAYFWRLWARSLELTNDAENILTACAMWESFRQNAIQEGWFSPNGQEAATLYLHMAGLLRTIPESELDEVQHAALAKSGNRPSDDQVFFIFPEKLYERACTLDPHFEAFSKWLEWAKGQKGWQAEQVAKAWHKIRPTDIEPILHLMHDAAKRNAFPTALQFLTKAERIDTVNPSVRRARLQLLASSAIKHLQQKKAHLAQQKLAEIAGLPQAQQGDRPAFVQALRYLTSSVGGDREAAAGHRAEIERLLGGKVAAWLLLWGVAAAAKHTLLEQIDRPEKLDKSERAAIPAGLARVVALAADMNAMKLDVPWPYVDEASKQLARDSKPLDASQLRALAESGVCASHRELAFAATKAGLERGGPTEARFLLLRAKSLPEGDTGRGAICATAAAELARAQRDMQLVEEAVEFSRGKFGPLALDLSLEQAAEVVRKERAEIRFPRFAGEGPNYRNLFPKDLCQCPEGRRERGESVSPFEDFDVDDELEELFEEFAIPPDMPPEIARMLFEETKRAAMNGESLDTLLNRVLGGMGPRRKSKKGRRR
jgi:hypothetical protein